MKTNNPNGKAMTHSLYLQDALKDIPPAKPLPKTPEGMTREEYIKSLQPKSTQAIMDRPKDQDLAWQNRPLSTEGQTTLKDAETMGSEEFKGKLNQRDLDPNEVSHIEAIRRRPKNSQFGPTEKDKGYSPEKYEMAKQGFLYSPPANPTQEEIETRLSNMTQIKSTPPPKETWVEMNWFQALIHRIRGNKIKPVEQSTQTTWRNWSANESEAAHQHDLKKGK